MRHPHHFFPPFRSGERLCGDPSPSPSGGFPGYTTSRTAVMNVTARTILLKVFCGMKWTIL